MENPRRIHHEMKGFHDHLPMSLETSQNAWCMSVSTVTPSSDSISWAKSLSSPCWIFSKSYGDSTSSSSFDKCGAFSDKDGVLGLLSRRRTMQSVSGRQEKDYAIYLW
ncbi:hypothetical protein L2E82_48246 [Cichorium intybus]|uniref:Uncharacterized protein n=1 Tax=Cichorium intybus TaxID=13427 RepID=A0ACB8YYA5_CICIN|nr:hypothetical protein L2E82_48246 [Cichorium intybus]